jgi:hypothetical protein
MQLDFPPTYLRHLKLLLHQWLELEQQQRHDIPGQDATSIWEPERLGEIEKVV